MIHEYAGTFSRTQYYHLIKKLNIYSIPLKGEKAPNRANVPNMTLSVKFGP